MNVMALWGQFGPTLSEKYGLTVQLFFAVTAYYVQCITTVPVRHSAAQYTSSFFSKKVICTI